MTDEQLLRYSRHILLDEIGIEGQEKILASHVLVVGAGGLGSPALLYLAAAGVGRITVVDDDDVDFSNLQRQIAHTTGRVGVNKAVSAAHAMHELNPDVQVDALAVRVDHAALDALVSRADLVLDCTDNYVTRQAINAACVRHQRPLVAGAVIRLDAQLMVFDPRLPSSPCYACLFSPDAAFEDAACATLGVLGPLVGMVGAAQAAEAMKLLVGYGVSLAGCLLLLDGRAMTWTRMATSRDPHCTVCGHAGHGLQQTVL